MNNECVMACLFFTWFKTNKAAVFEKFVLIYFKIYFPNTIVSADVNIIISLKMKLGTSNHLTLKY